MRVRVWIFAVAGALAVSAATGCSGPGHEPDPVPATVFAPSTSAPPLTITSVDPRLRCDSIPTPPPAVPPGGIGLPDLCDVTLTVPGWRGTGPGAERCPSGPVAFKQGAYFIAASTFVNLGSGALVSDRGLGYSDIDHDGDAETLILLSCGGEGWRSQVIAVDRAANGAVRTIGQILTPGGGVPRIMSVAGATDGSVLLEVSDWPGFLGDDGSRGQPQRRGFSWDGRGFAQVAGPTSFPPNPKFADLSVRTTDLAFGPAGGGTRTGTMAVTVRNDGPAAAPYRLSVTVPSFAAVKSLSAGCAADTDAASVRTVTCKADALAAGGTRTFTFTFRAPAASTDADNTRVASIFIEDDGMGDPVYDNDSAEFRLTFA